MLFVRSFKETDLQDLLELRKETIRFINSADYSDLQIEAWIGEETEEENQRRLQIFNASCTFVAEEGDNIVGFANLFLEQHYFDQLYVSKDHQHQGVGVALLSAIEQKALENGLDQITVESSITAKPFFEHNGYKLVLPQQKNVTSNVVLTNYIMNKQLTPSDNNS